MRTLSKGWRGWHGGSCRVSSTSSSGRHFNLLVGLFLQKFYGGRLEWGIKNVDRVEAYSHLMSSMRLSSLRHSSLYSLGRWRLGVNFVFLKKCMWLYVYLFSIFNIWDWSWIIFSIDFVFFICVTILLTSFSLHTSDTRLIHLCHPSP